MPGRQNSGDLLNALSEEKRKILTPEFRYALSIIADKMYKEKHFIRELIQNADDAKSRKIVFKIDTKNKIVSAINYGKLFSERDVKQICTMLPSAKTSSEIGALGVGFKSVFAVSDRPSIYSNSFCFELTDYIVPQEVKDIRDKSDLNSTVFVIPLNDKMPCESVIERFESITDQTILFLKNIRDIEVFVDNIQFLSVKKRLISTSKHHNLKIKHVIISRILNDKKTDLRFILITKKIIVPDENRQQVKQTLLGEMQRIYQDPLAFFGLKELENRLESKAPRAINPTIAILADRKWNFLRIMNAKLFMGLPSEIKTGLHFHINAEFRPSADRGGIEDDVNNKWILLRLSEVICEATEFMRAKKKYAQRFYAILPDNLNTERIDSKELVFDVIFSQILTYLKNNPFFLTRKGTWGKLEEVCSFQHKEIPNLLSEKDLSDKFGMKWFISNQIISQNRPFFSSINLFSITLEKFIDFTFDYSLISLKPPNWFFEAYAYLGNHIDKEDNKLIERLRNESIIFTGQNTLLSSLKEKIFLPKQKQSMDYLFLNKEIRLVHEEISKRLDRKDKKSTKVKFFLSLMGVNEYSSYYIIEDIIIPKYKSDKWMQETTETLFEFVLFIKNNLRDYVISYNKLTAKEDQKVDALERLRQTIYLRTDRTEKDGERSTNYYDFAPNLHLPSVYTNTKSLEILFTGTKSRFIHPFYAKQGKESKRSWVEFFRKMGAENKLGIKVSLEETNYDYKVQGILGDDEISWRERSASGWNELINYDKTSKDIKELLELTQALPDSQRRKRLEKIIKSVDKNWEVYEQEAKKKISSTSSWDSSSYTSLDSSKWKYHYQSWNSKKIHSTLKRMLAKTLLPTDKGCFSESSGIYINDSAIRAAVGDKVHFLAFEITHSSLISLLGVNRFPKKEDILANLIDTARNDFQEKKVRFLLDYLNEPEDIAHLIEEISKEASTDGIAKLAVLAYQNLNGRILASETSNFPIERQDWWRAFKSKAKILAYDGEFREVDSLRFPPSPQLNTILIRSGIVQIPFLRSDWRQYETLARQLGVQELRYGVDIKCRLVEPEPEKVPNLSDRLPKFEKMIQDSVPYANGVEAKKVINEGERLEYNKLFFSLQVFSVQSLRVQYYWESNNNTIDGAPIPSIIFLQQRTECNKILIRKDSEDDKTIYELLANEISLLTNPKGDRDYVAKTLKECFLGFPPLDLEQIESLSSDINLTAEPINQVTYELKNIAATNPINEVVTGSPESLHSIPQPNISTAELQTTQSIVNSNLTPPMIVEKSSLPNQPPLNIGINQNGEPVGTDDSVDGQSIPIEVPTVIHDLIDKEKTVEEGKIDVPSLNGQISGTEVETAQQPTEGKNEELHQEIAPSEEKAGIKQIEIPAMDKPPAEPAISAPIDEVPNKDSQEPLTEELPKDKESLVEGSPEEPANGNQEHEETPIDDYMAEQLIEAPPPDEETPMKVSTYPAVTEQRDTTKAKWVKRSYNYNCQICLSQETPGILTYPKSYAKPEINRRYMIQGHHIKEVKKDMGDDHVGNILSLCTYHHMSCLHHPYPFTEPLIDIIGKSIENLNEKDIIWPNGSVSKWKVLDTGQKLKDGQPFLIVFNLAHLDQVQKYIKFLELSRNNL
jgi:hypothetical protein